MRLQMLQRYRNSLRLFLAGLLCAIVALVSAPAWAASDVEDTGFRDTTIKDDTLLEQGRFEVMVQSAGLLSRDSSDTVDGSTETFTSLYMNPEGAIGYMLLDELQLRVSLGWLRISTATSETSLQDFNAGQGTLQALYHIELPYGTAIYTGAGAGFFYGATARPGPAENTTVSNATSGFAAQGLVGLLLQPGPRVILRTGLRVDGLFSSETLDDATGDSISSTNVKMMGQFGVGFRF
ncbi:MAG: hypothetical protein ACQEVA_14520 [Myxococcota bacterium]